MLLVLKLTLVPLAVTLASIVARRFGTRAGGVVTGLPVAAGPVSIFLAVEYGRSFAGDAALAMLLSLVAISAYATVFFLTSRTWRLPYSVAAGFAAHLTTTAVLSGPAFNLAAASALAFGAVLLALLIVRVPEVAQRRSRPAKTWELPLRIVTATTIVLLITLSAELIGARVAGLLTTLPIVACVLAVSAFIEGGREEGMIAVRGHLIGSLSLGTFFIVVTALIERLDLVATYLLAIAAAIAVNRLATFAERPTGRSHRHHPDQLGPPAKDPLP